MPPLQKIVDLIWGLMKLVGLIKEKVEEERAKEAVEEGLEERDQRKIEEAMGGSTGPTRRKYFGLFTRPRSTEKKEVQ